MNYIDFIILIIVAVFTIKGLFRGLIFEVIGLVGLLISLIVATKFMSNAAELISHYVSIPPTFSTILGYIVIFVLMQLFFHFLSHILQKLVKYTFLGWLEKVSGGMVGFTKGAVISSLLALLLTILPLSELMIPQQDKSVLLKPVSKFAPRMFNYMVNIIPNSKDFSGELKESLKEFSNAPINSMTQEILKELEEKVPDKDSKK